MYVSMAMIAAVITVNASTSELDEFSSGSASSGIVTTAEVGVDGLTNESDTVDRPTPAETVVGGAESTKSARVTISQSSITTDDVTTRGRLTTLHAMTSSVARDVNHHGNRTSADAKSMTSRVSGCYLGDDGCGRKSSTVQSQVR